MNRFCDVAVAVTALIIAAPVLVIAAILIVLDDGWPVIYRSRRIGRAGAPYEALKLRTMAVNADDLLDARGNVSTDTVRVTPSGRFLRAWSIDELPQLINVVRGEMAIVGPRPMLPEMAARLRGPQRLRFQVRPGLTGLAQISGRNQLRWSSRLSLDIKYVQERSPWLDLSIMLRTVRVVVTRQGFVSDRNPHEVDDLPGHADGDVV